MAKGSRFERDVCKRLSLWWTGEQRRDDIFWRTAGSGGRGTVRGRRGKRTAGGCGDICAMDQFGEPLLDLMTIEVKRGYSRYTLADLLDKAPHRKAPIWIEWVQQAERSSRDAGSFAWAVIAKRDQQQAIIVLPERMYKQLPAFGTFIPQMILTFGIGKERQTIWATTLDGFLAAVDPKMLRQLARTV